VITAYSSFHSPIISAHLAHVARNQFQEEESQFGFGAEVKGGDELFFPIYGEQHEESLNI
jgi:hypothetical protein